MKTIIKSTTLIPYGTSVMMKKKDLFFTIDEDPVRYDSEDFVLFIGIFGREEGRKKKIKKILSYGQDKEINT